MRQAAKRAQQNTRAAPGRRGRREVEYALVVDGAEAPIDLGLFGELLLDEPNAHARQRSLEGIQLLRQVHIARVRSPSTARNLEVSEQGLIRWRNFDSPGKTVDRGG